MKDLSQIYKINRAGKQTICRNGKSWHMVGDKAICSLAVSQNV
jgi:hypothetical protein